MDVAFSGILTNLKQKLDSRQYNLNDLAYSLQEFVLQCWLKLQSALAHTGENELLLAGGVVVIKGCRKCAELCAMSEGKIFLSRKIFTC